MASRGMNMRDMKTRSMDKAPKTTSAPKTGQKRLDRGLPGRRTQMPIEPRPSDDDARDVSDEMDEAVHMAQSDGHFAPAARRFQCDEDEGHDCPDEPPPGWEDR